MAKKSWADRFLDDIFGTGKKSGSGDRRKGQVHQESRNPTNNYRSGPRTDGSGGRFISSGSNKNHTTNLYDSKGNYQKSKPRGNGGPNAKYMKSNP